LASYFNQRLGYEDFDIQATENLRPSTGKVQGTLQGTIQPILIKGVNGLSSSLQLTFEVPCENQVRLNKLMAKIENLCGMENFNLDIDLLSFDENGNEVIKTEKYTCLSQLQMERPMTSPQNSNGALQIIITLTGAVLVKYGEDNLSTGFEVETYGSLDGVKYEELSVISVGIKCVKNGESDMTEESAVMKPYFVARNTFYVIDAYYTGKDFDKAIRNHIESIDNDIDLFVWIKRVYPDGQEVIRKCAVISDSQIMETPATFNHYVVNLQGVE
jgi:hypothetical protein